MSEPLFTLAPKYKAVVAFVISALVFGLGLLTDGSFDLQDGIALAGWVGATIGVYEVPNKA